MTHPEIFPWPDFFEARDHANEFGRQDIDAEGDYLQIIYSDELPFVSIESTESVRKIMSMVARKYAIVWSERNPWVRENWSYKPRGISFSPNEIKKIVQVKETINNHPDLLDPKSLEESRRLLGYCIDTMSQLPFEPTPKMRIMKWLYRLRAFFRHNGIFKNLS